MATPSSQPDKYPVRYREIIDPPALPEAGLINPQAVPSAARYKKLTAKPAKLQAQIREQSNGAARNASALRVQLATTR